MVASVLPKLLAFIAQLPQPIRGAILVYTAGYMLVSSMQLALSRMLNNRRMFMIGLSTCVGDAVILIPELTEHAPAGMKPVLGSGLTMGCLTAVVLNLLFTMGVKKTGQTAILGHAAGGRPPAS
jgi:xanthine permease XanP